MNMGTVAAIAVIASAVASDICATAPPTLVSLCELVAHPHKYDHKLVSFDARVESDGLEYTSLFSESCPRVALHLGENAVNGDVRSLILLRRAIDKVYFHGPNSSHLTVTTQITGYFYVDAEYVEYSALHEVRPVSAKEISVRYGIPLFKEVTLPRPGSPD